MNYKLVLIYFKEIHTRVEIRDENISDLVSLLKDLNKISCKIFILKLSSIPVARKGERNVHLSTLCCSPFSEIELFE